MMSRIFLLGAAAIAGAALAPVAAAAAAQDYQVSMRMTGGGAAPATPTLRMRTGEPATFAIANDSYNLRLTATTDANDNVAIASLVSSWTARGLVNRDQQLRIRADGTPATMTFDVTDPVTGGASPVRIEVSVRPVTR
jgi:outer membrane protein W